MEKHSEKYGFSRFFHKLKSCFCKSVSNTVVTLQNCIEKALKKCLPGNAVVNILHWRDIIEWFQEWMNETENVNKDAIGFTISESAEAGNYILVQGVFNKESNCVEDARRITAEEVDDEIKHNCFRKKVTLFT